MRKCLNCNKKTDNPKFCSLSCSSIYAGKVRRQNKVPVFKECKHCGSLFESTGKIKQFCNNSCAASFNNKGQAKNKPTNPKTIAGIETTHCLNCNKELHKRNQRYNICCSHKCLIEYKQKEVIKKWLAEPSSATLADGSLSETVRNYLIEQAGNICPCGDTRRNPVTKKRPLEINHIDGNSRNNNPDNLEVLCPTCHALTPNYGALNKGKSNRLDRRHKYRQGQMIEHGEYKFFE